MTFGTIYVTSKQIEVPVKEVKKKDVKVPVEAIPLNPVVYEKGASQLNVLLVAPSYAQAEEFLCGVYVDSVKMTAGKEIAAYVREYETITRISEIKQELEEQMQSPIGTNIKRNRNPEDAMKECTITLGQAGNQNLSLDLNFHCNTYDHVSDGNEEVVFILINYKDGPEIVRKYKNSFSDRKVFWIITGFEDIAVQVLDEERPFDQNVRKKIKEDLELSEIKDAYIAYVQIYGGFGFVQKDGTQNVYCTNRKCREYIPLGCQVPCFRAIKAMSMKLLEENPAFDNLKKYLEKSY